MAAIKKLKDGWASVFGNKSSNAQPSAGSSSSGKPKPSSSPQPLDDSSLYPAPLESSSMTQSNSGHSSVSHGSSAPDTNTINSSLYGSSDTLHHHNNNDDATMLDHDIAASVIARAAASSGGIRDPQDAMIGLATPDDRKHPDVPLSTPTPMYVDDLPRRASSLKQEAERLERHRIFNEILQDRHRFAHFLRFVDRNSQPNPQQPDEMPMFGPSSLSELLLICEINQLLERDRSMDSLDLVSTVSRMVHTYIKGSHGEIPVAGIRASTRLHLLSVLSTLESVAAAIPHQRPLSPAIPSTGGNMTPTDHRRRPSLPGGSTTGGIAAALTPARLFQSTSTPRVVGGGEGIPIQQRKELMMLLKWARDEVEDQLTLKSLALYLEHVDANSELELAASYEFADVLRDNSCYRSFLLFLMEDRRYRPLIFFWEFSAVRAEERIICGTPSPQTSFNNSNVITPSAAGSASSSSLSSLSTPLSSSHTTTRSGTPLSLSQSGGLISPTMAITIISPLPITPVSMASVLHNEPNNSSSLRIATPTSSNTPAATPGAAAAAGGTSDIDINLLAPLAPEMVLSPTLSPVPPSGMSSSPSTILNTSLLSDGGNDSGATAADDHRLLLHRLAELCDRITDIYYRFVTCAPQLPGASPLDLLQTSTHDMLIGQPAMLAAVPNSPPPPPVAVTGALSTNNGRTTSAPLASVSSSRAIPLPPVVDDDYDMPHNSEEYWRARIGRYMAFLIPLSKKTEKVLRLQLWPQFCRSKYYKDLASRRARHLARSKDKDRLMTQTKLMRGKSTDGPTSKALTAMAMAKSSTGSLPLSATLAALASSLSSSTATAPLVPLTPSSSLNNLSSLAAMFTAPTPPPAAAAAATVPLSSSSMTSSVISSSISSMSVPYHAPHPPSSAPPPLVISPHADFALVPSASSSGPIVPPSPNPPSSITSVAAAVAAIEGSDTNSSTSTKRVVFSSDTTFAASPSITGGVPLTRTASLSVDRAPVPPPISAKRTTSGSGVIPRPGSESQNTMAAMLGGVANDIIAFATAPPIPSTAPGGSYRPRSSPERKSRQRSASEERAAAAAGGSSSSSGRPSTSHGTPSKAKVAATRTGAAAAGGFGAAPVHHTNVSATTTGLSATVRVRSSKDQKERESRPLIQSISFTAPSTSSSATVSGTSSTRERNKSVDAKSSSAPAVTASSSTLSRSNSGSVAATSSSSSSRKSQGPMERERRHSTTMVSWLKQQKVTRDMIVIECQTIGQARDRKSRHDNPLGRPLKHQRMFEYVAILRATNNVARSNSVPIGSGTSSGSSRSRTTDSLSGNNGNNGSNAAAAAAAAAGNKPKSLYKIEMTHRFPQTDHAEAGLPQHIGELCFPDNADIDGLCSCRHPVATKHRDGQLKDHWGFPVNSNGRGHDNDTRSAYLDAIEKERLKRHSCGGDKDRLFNFILTTVDGTRLYGACIQIFEDDDNIIDETHNTNTGKSLISGSGKTGTSTKGGGAGSIDNSDDDNDDNDNDDDANDYQGEYDDEKEERDRLISEQKERQRAAALASLNQLSGVTTEPSSPGGGGGGTISGTPHVVTSSVLLTPPPVRSRGNTDSKIQRPSSAAPSTSSSSSSTSSSTKVRSDRHRLRSMDPDSLRYRRAGGDGSSSSREGGSPIPVVGRRTASPLQKRRRPNGYAVVILSALPLVQLLREALRSLPLQRDMNIDSVIMTPQFQRLISFTKPAQIPIDLFGVDNSPLQVPAHDFSFGILFRCLHPRRVLLVVESLILERKILLLSSQNSILTLIGECLRSLLYPFKWNYLYIPILPLSMFVYLECPTPFLMGLHSCYKERALDLLDKDVVIVDLDNDEVVCRTQDKSQHRLPVSCRSHLLSVMQHLYFPTLTTLDLPSVRTSLCAAFYPHITPPGVPSSSPHAHLTTVLHHVHQSSISSQSSLSSPNNTIASSSLPLPLPSMPFFSTLSSQLADSGRAPSSPFVSPRAASGASIPPLDIVTPHASSLLSSLATIDERTGFMSSSNNDVLPRIYDRTWFRHQFGDDQFGGVRVIPDPSIELRLEFLKMWTSIMAGYRHFAVYLPDSQRVTKPRIDRTTGVAPIMASSSFTAGISSSGATATGLPSSLSSSSIDSNNGGTGSAPNSRAPSQSSSMDDISAVAATAGGMHERSRSHSTDDTTSAAAAAATNLHAVAAASSSSDDRSEPTMVFDSASFVLAKAATGALRTSLFVSALVKTSYFPIFLYERTVPSGLASVSRDAFDRYEATFTGARRGPARGEVIIEDTSSSSLWRHRAGAHGAGVADPSINRLNHLKGWDVHTTLTFHHLCRIPLSNFTDAPDTVLHPHATATISATSALVSST